MSGHGLQLLHRLESMPIDRFITLVGRAALTARFCTMSAKSYYLYIERRDANRNMARFYALEIEPTLFGDTCLTRRWGRIGTRGQILRHQFEHEQDALHFFLDLLRHKRLRGYRTRFVFHEKILP